MSGSMELRDYVYALRRFWWVAAACTLVGLFAAIAYNQATYLDQASTYVAVVSPKLAANSTGGGQAQVSFGAVIQSYTLATIVAKDLGEDPDTVAANLSVT